MRASDASRRLAILAVVLVVLVAAAVVVGSRQRDGGGTAAGSAGPTTPSSSGPSASLTGGASAAVATATATEPSAPAPPTSAAYSSATAPSVGASPIPMFRHVYVIVMENREYREIVGNSHAPYINQLIDRYGLATDYTAVAHPSEPNYLALFSGSTQGVSDDGVHDLTGTNLADQLEAHKRTWRVFAENVPGGCFTGAVAHGGPDGDGTYTRKHEPAISFTDISGDPKRCGGIVGLRRFDPAAADFELIVPNMCHDGHDCSTAQADAFLRGFVPTILTDPAMTDSVLFLTWDEGDSRVGGGGRVVTVVVGPGVKPGYRSAVRHSHYSLLRTIQEAWGLGCLNHSCQANDLREFFR